MQSATCKYRPNLEQAWGSWCVFGIIFQFLFAGAVASGAHPIPQKPPLPGSPACDELLAKFSEGARGWKPLIADFQRGLRVDSYLLRPLIDDDFTELRQMYSDPEYRAMERMTVFGTEELLEWYRLFALYPDAFGGIGVFQLAVYDCEANQLVGLVQAYGLSDDFRIQIGYGIRREFWGKGIMGKVLPAFLTHIKATLRIYRFRAEASETNAASNRLLEKLGFAIVGMQENPDHPRDLDFIWERD